MWIVLDPEPDTVIERDFSESLEAVEWIDREIELATVSGDDDRVALLKRCVVAPQDPGRDAA
jgi:hypothetical protein